MSNPFSPNVQRHTPGFRAFSASPDAHVIEDLLQALVENDPERVVFAPHIAEHLAECAECCAQVNQIVGALSAPSLLEFLDLGAPAAPVAQQAHVSVHAAPSDEELSEYAFAFLVMGDEQAKRAYPEAAEHVRHCAPCTQFLYHAVDEARRLESRPLPVESAIVGASTGSRQSMWATIGAQIRRLSAPYIVSVRNAALSISSALVEPQIATEYLVSGEALQVRARRGEPVKIREESLSFDLREGDEAPWIHGRLHLRAGSIHSDGVQRITCELTVRKVMSAQEKSGAPVAGIPWRILTQKASDLGQDGNLPDHISGLTGGAPTPEAMSDRANWSRLRGGTTDTQGQARFKLQFEPSASRLDVLLELEADERRWQTPVVIRAVAESDSD